MKTKVLVKNLQGLITHGPFIFDSQELAEAWVNSVKPTGGFGPVAYTEIVIGTGSPAVFDDDGAEITPAIPPDTIEHQDQFTVEYSDGTAESESEESAKKRAKRMADADKFFIDLAERNKAAIIAGTMTVEQALSVDKKLEDVQRLMKMSGSYELALAKYQTLDLPELPTDLKNEFVVKIQTYLSNE